MAIAPFHLNPRPGEANRAPAGGCWVPQAGPYRGSLPSFAGGQAAGQKPDSGDRPPLFFPEGYWLPAGTTEYAKLYSQTNQDRIIEYLPWEYTPVAIAGLRAIQEANAARVPRLLAEGILQPGEVDNYIRTRGLTQADLRRIERAEETGLRPGEVYIGRPAMVIFQVGTRANVRRAMVQALWADIEATFEGYK